VLHLLDEVLMALLGEATALLSVKVHVVTPHLNTVEEAAVIGRQVDVKANLMVLESNQGQVETRVAVEEEDQGETNIARRSLCATGRDRGHLTPLSLLGVVEVKLGVQAPPSLVVLVNALTANGQLNVLDGTLSRPARTIGASRKIYGRGLGGEDGKIEEHIANEITVAGNGDRDAATRGRRAIDNLLDHLHSEVGVALVYRLEKGNLGVTGKIDVLRAVSY
tara:strand:- start:14380 stop:15045 length:666 start_codon:yes stop_codon:yes gene_type:complete